MLYAARITIPPWTQEEYAIWEPVLLTRGLIRSIQVGFPAGCAELARVQVFDKSWQLLPWSPGEYMAWDNRVFEFPMLYPMIVEPYQVQVKAWNLDDTWNHTVWVGVLFEEGEPELELIKFVKELQRVAGGP